MSAWLLPPRAPEVPRPSKCLNCGRIDAVATCTLCGTDRPALAALKSISAKLRAQKPAGPTCRYYPYNGCDCGARGLCLEAA